MGGPSPAMAWEAGSLRQFHPGRVGRRPVGTRNDSGIRGISGQGKIAPTGKTTGVPPYQGFGQPSQLICRAQRNIDALLMPVAMVAIPANRPTIVAMTAIRFCRRVRTMDLRISIGLPSQ
jgi:hypothetical protein